MAHMLQVYAKNPSIHVHYFLGPFNTRKRNTFQQVSNVKTWFLVCLDTTFKCQKEKVICRGPLHGWISDHQLRLCHTWRPLAATNIENLFIIWSFLNWGLIIILWRWVGSHTNTGQARLVSNWPWKDLMISVQQKCLMKIRVHLSHICSGIKCIYDDIYIHVCKWNVKCKDTTSLITTHYDMI